MNKVFAGLLCLFLVGCNTTTQQEPPSYFFEGQGATSVKAKLIGLYAPKGWRIVKDTDFSIEIDRLSQNTAITIFTTCMTCSPPRARIVFSLSPKDTGTTVYWYGYWLANEGRPAERRHEMGVKQSAEILADLQALQSGAKVEGDRSKL